MSTPDRREPPSTEELTDALVSALAVTCGAPDGCRAVIFGFLAQTLTRAALQAKRELLEEMECDAEKEHDKWRDMAKRARQTGRDDSTFESLALSELAKLDWVRGFAAALPTEQGTEPKGQDQ